MIYFIIEFIVPVMVLLLFMKGISQMSDSKANINQEKVKEFHKTIYENYKKQHEFHENNEPLELSESPKKSDRFEEEEYLIEEDYEFEVANGYKKEDLVGNFSQVTSSIIYGARFFSQ